jgi:hypothetical protein
MRFLRDSSDENAGPETVLSMGSPGIICYAGIACSRGAGRAKGRKMVTVVPLFPCSAVLEIEI